MLTLPLAVVQSPLSAGAKLAYGALALQAESGLLGPEAMTQAARLLLVSERQFRRYLRELQAARLLAALTRGFYRLLGLVREVADTCVRSLDFRMNGTKTNMGTEYDRTGTCTEESLAENNPEVPENGTKRAKKRKAGSAGDPEQPETPKTPKRRKSELTEEQTAEYQRVWEGLCERVPYVPSPAREGRSIRLMVQRGHSAETILKAYDHYRRDAYWRDKFLSMSYVDRNVDALLVSLRAERTRPGAVSYTARVRGLGR